MKKTVIGLATLVLMVGCNSGEAPSGADSAEGYFKEADQAQKDGTLVEAPPPAYEVRSGNGPQAAGGK
jgi:hypothetical protein